MNPVNLAVLSILFSIAAQFALKAGMSSPDIKGIMGQAIALQTVWTLIANKFLLLGFFLYGCGAVVWLWVLSSWDVSKAYPMVGAGFALTTIIGLLAGENITLLRAGGVAMICVGVFLVGQS